MSAVNDEALANPAEMADQIAAASAYRLAHEDAELLSSDDLRPLRLQLEYLKPERAMRAAGIKSTIVVFGSARILSLGDAAARLDQVQSQNRDNPGRPNAHNEMMAALRAVKYSRYYSEAQRFASLVSRRFQHEGRREFVVVTGGGPGIMEAANRGAFQVGAPSVGLNVALPHEQQPNPYITPELAFRFHYFSLRKMHFLLRAKALVAFPGGFGTIDELFEVLTLVQTCKMPKVPVILVGSAFWKRLIDFDFLCEEDLVSREDLTLFSYAESADDIVRQLESYYGGQVPSATTPESVS